MLSFFFSGIKNMYYYEEETLSKIKGEIYYV